VKSRRAAAVLHGAIIVFAPLPWTPTALID